MDRIKICDVIDLNDKIEEWNTEIQKAGLISYAGWELEFYPICGDILVLTFECVINTNEQFDLYEYRFLQYDLVKQKFLEKNYSISLYGQMCCKVLEIDESGLLLDIWDIEEDINIILHSKDMCTVVASGYGPSMSACLPNSNRIVVGYGYEAVRYNQEVPIKIYDKTTGASIYRYINSKALGCDDIYVDTKGIVWASFWGDNRIVKIDGDVICEYDCEMNGFAGILMVEDERTLYMNFAYDDNAYGDRIFKMNLKDGKFRNAREVKIIDDFNKEIGIKKISSENGYALGLLNENIVGVLRFNYDMRPTL